jgi:hypothetical protein
MVQISTSLRIHVMKKPSGAIVIDLRRYVHDDASMSWKASSKGIELTPAEWGRVKERMGAITERTHALVESRDGAEGSWRYETLKEMSLSDRRRLRVLSRCSASEGNEGDAGTKKVVVDIRAMMHLDDENVLVRKKGISLLPTEWLTLADYIPYLTSGFMQGPTISMSVNVRGSQLHRSRDD